MSLKLPDLLPYKRIAAFDAVPELVGVFCYFLKDYDDSDGMSVVIKREGGVVHYKFGTLGGELIDPADTKHSQHKDLETLAIYGSMMASVMQLIHLDQAQFYWARQNEKLVLVDMLVALNKLAGPGMLRELFGKIVPCQEFIKTDFAPEQTYSETIILKPSAFKMMVRGDDAVPIYARLKNETK